MTAGHFTVWTQTLWTSLYWTVKYIIENIKIEEKSFNSQLQVADNFFYF